MSERRLQAHTPGARSSHHCDDGRVAGHWWNQVGLTRLLMKVRCKSVQTPGKGLVARGEGKDIPSDHS